MNFKQLAMILLSTCVAAQVNGAEEPTRIQQLLALDLSEILEVEVATGTAKQVSVAPSSVSVITAEDIKAMGARTLAEAVEQIPGLHVAASQTRMNRLFSIRGIQSFGTPQVLVLIDGVELSELTQLPIPYSFRYPVNNIERIEVIRGPGSAVYGADAVSGVINIITKTVEQSDSVEVGANYGSFDYAETWVNANTVYNDFAIRFSATYEKQNNDNDRVTQYGVLDRRRHMNNVHLDVEYGQFTLKNWYWRVKQQMGNGAGLVGNMLDRDDSTAWKTQLNWQDSLSADLDGEVNLAYSHNSFDGYFQLFPPGTWPVGEDGNLFQPPFTPVQFPDGVVGNPFGESDRIQASGALTYSGFKGHRLRLGIGAARSDFDDVGEIKNFGPGILDLQSLPINLISDNLIDVTGTPFVFTPTYDRDLRYVFVQDEWEINRNWALTAGLRYDNYSDFSSTVNPRLALVWNVSKTLTSKLLYGSAFRAPRVAELAFINNPASLGNPNLRPEEIDTWELVFDYRPHPNFTGLLNLYTYHAERLIQLDQTFTYANSGEQEGRGIEIETSWQVSPRLRINANASWLDAELPLSNQDKAQVPGFMGFFDIRYNLAKDWLVTSQTYWIAQRQRERGDPRLDIDDYVKTDVTLLWQVSDNWDARLSARNLFNRDVRLPSPNSPLFPLGLGFPDDFPMQGRSLFGSISYAF